jgi:hypothetical protein
MNIRSFTFPAVAIISTAVLACGAQPAQAFALRAVPMSIYQNGATAGVFLGHTVIASTNMNRLIAGGSFTATCASTDTGTITGQRTLSAEGLGAQLYVTIPEWLPALRGMPGFEYVPAGSTLLCTYDWTAHAEESTYTMGIPGFGTTIGGQRGSHSDSVTFVMIKPAAGGDDDNNGCIH